MAQQHQQLTEQSRPTEGGRKHARLRGIWLAMLLALAFLALFFLLDRFMSSGEATPSNNTEVSPAPAVR